MSTLRIGDVEIEVGGRLSVEVDGKKVTISALGAKDQESPEELGCVNPAPEIPTETKEGKLTQKEIAEEIFRRLRAPLPSYPVYPVPQRYPWDYRPRWWWESPRFLLF